MVTCPVHFAWQRSPRSAHDVKHTVVIDSADVIAHDAADAADIYSNLIDSVIRPIRQFARAHDAETRPYPS